MKTYEKIKLIREQQNLTQEELAEKLFMSVSGYSKIERGESQINLQRLQQIADILQVALFDLMPDNNISINNNGDNSYNYQFNIGTNQILQSEIEKLNLIITHKNELLAQKITENELLKQLVESLKNK